MHRYAQIFTGALATTRARNGQRGQCRTFKDVVIGDFGGRWRLVAICKEQRLKARQQSFFSGSPFLIATRSPQHRTHLPSPSSIPFTKIIVLHLSSCKKNTGGTPQQRKKGPKQARKPRLTTCDQKMLNLLFLLMELQRRGGDSSDSWPRPVIAATVSISHRRLSRPFCFDHRLFRACHSRRRRVAGSGRVRKGRGTKLLVHV